MGGAAVCGGVSGITSRRVVLIRRRMGPGQPLPPCRPGDVRPAADSRVDTTGEQRNVPGVRGSVMCLPVWLAKRLGRTAALRYPTVLLGSVIGLRSTHAHMSGPAIPSLRCGLERTSADVSPHAEPAPTHQPRPGPHSLTSPGKDSHSPVSPRQVGALTSLAELPRQHGVEPTLTIGPQIGPTRRPAGGRTALTHPPTQARTHGPAPGRTRRTHTHESAHRTHTHVSAPTDPTHCKSRQNPLTGRRQRVCGSMRRSFPQDVR